MTKTKALQTFFQPITTAENGFYNQKYLQKIKERQAIFPDNLKKTGDKYIA